MPVSPPVVNSMRQTATIRRPIHGELNPLRQPTPGGASTFDVPCRAWETTQHEVTADGKWFTLTGWKMRVPLDTDIKEEDRVVFDDTLLRVETPPIKRRGHLLVTLETLQRDVIFEALDLQWADLQLTWADLDLQWEGSG